MYRFVLESGDLVFQLQLALFEVGELEGVGAGMVEGVLDLFFERLMTTFKFGKMRFQGHQQCLLLTVRTCSVCHSDPGLSNNRTVIAALHKTLSPSCTVTFDVGSPDPVSSVPRT